MLVLGAVLAGILTVVLILLIYICIKSCCLCCAAGGNTMDVTAGSKSSMKNSGVIVEAAKFQSFKDTTYLTLREPSNFSSSSESLPRDGYGQEDTDSTASA